MFKNKETNKQKIKVFKKKVKAVVLNELVLKFIHQKVLNKYNIIS